MPARVTSPDRSRLQVEKGMALRPLVPQAQAEIDTCCGMNQTHVAEALRKIAQ
jgi:hypothetical protein